MPHCDAYAGLCTAFLGRLHAALLGVVDKEDLASVLCYFILFPSKHTTRLPAPAAGARPCHQEALVAVAHPTRRGAYPFKKQLRINYLYRLQVVRGVVPLRMECAPAFNYARSQHATAIVPSASPEGTFKAVFESDALALDLRYVPESTMLNVDVPTIKLDLLDLSEKGHLGLGVQAELLLEEGQCVTFVLRTPPGPNAANSFEDPHLTKVIYLIVEHINLRCSSIYSTHSLRTSSIPC